MLAARVGEESGSVRVSSAKQLFSARMVTGHGYLYDVSADGKRFLVVTSSGSTTTPLTLVVDWLSEVRR